LSLKVSLAKPRRRPFGAVACSLFLLPFVLLGCNNSVASDIVKKVAPPSAAPEPSTEPATAPEGPKAGFEIGMAAMGQRTPVIMYHDIIERRGKGSVWFDCTTDEFKKGMDLIVERGYTPVSLKDLHEHLTTGKSLPPKAIVLTFDDNYQGFYDRAYPILKEHNFPAAIFVHTGFVGDKSGAHPKMGWDTLQELCKDPLITIASHTVTHPDLPTLTSDKQVEELTKSKEELESHLGIKVDYFAYPEGKNDAATQGYTKDAGYTLAFSIANGPAEESPSILCVNRWVHTRLEKALDECEAHTAGGGDAVVTATLKPTPVEFVDQEVDGTRLVMLKGGTPETVMSDTRESVGQMVKRTGAAGGINGTFFAMAAIASTDNQLIGPAMIHGGQLMPDAQTTIWDKIRNRPLVMWGPTNLAIVPYNPDRMNDPEAFGNFMPDATDVFLGGVWLVHDGVAREKEALQTFGSKDIEDARRRAAFGIDADGRPTAACTRDSVSSSKFAQMLAQAGLKEAVLLDSGFSTSLVLGDNVLASGHSTATTPSRPVPHAIVLRGDIEPASLEAANKASLSSATAATAEEPAPRKHRRRRRR
jgi:peptidoglycan/xylan/chitin deacetylase (PgdA/CDA1 family)